MFTHRCQQIRCRTASGLATNPLRLARKARIMKVPAWHLGVGWLDRTTPDGRRILRKDHTRKMPTNTPTSGLLGRRVDDLSLTERLQFANQWIALKKYTPTKKISQSGMEFPEVRLRTVDASGADARACITQLKNRNLNPAEYEFTILKPPY